MALDRMANGKVVESRVIMDNMGLLQ